MRLLRRISLNKQGYVVHILFLKKPSRRKDYIPFWEIKSKHWVAVMRNTGNKTCDPFLVGIKAEMLVMANGELIDITAFINDKQLRHGSGGRAALSGTPRYFQTGG